MTSAILQYLDFLLMLVTLIIIVLYFQMRRQIYGSTRKDRKEIDEYVNARRRNTKENESKYYMIVESFYTTVVCMGLG